jgi:AAA family ATP:ADP antiporter
VARNPLHAVFDVRPGEGAAVAWAGVAFFAILASYFVLRPVRDAFVLDGDPAFIPWLWTATFVAMTALAAPWGWLVAKLPRSKFVPIVYRVFAVQLVGFAALVHWNVAPLEVGRVFYVWLSVFNLFVVSVFWSLCADVARPEQGRRLFGPIAAGGTAGALVGPILTRTLVEHVGHAALLLISVALLEAAVWCAYGLDRAARAMPAADVPAKAAAAPVGGTSMGGFVSVARSPYLAGIALYALCAATLATFVYLRQAGIVKVELPDRAARTRFFADVDLWTGIATLAIQMLLTARLMRWVGVGVVLAVLPFAQGIGAFVLDQWPTLTVAIAVSASGRAITHALSRPGRELLFTAVPREDKYKAKNVIDTLVYRFGDFGSAWLFHGLKLAGIAAAAFAVPLTVAWAALALALGVGHRRRTAAHEGNLPDARVHSDRK